MEINFYTIFLGIVIILLTIYAIYLRILINEFIKKTKELEKEKEDIYKIVEIHLKKYDGDILRQIIIKADYEESRRKLKERFGFTDEDFTIPPEKD